MRRAIVGRAILGRIVVGRRKPVVVAIVSLLIVAGVANAAWASSHNKRGHAAVGGISASSSKNGAISADQSGAPASSATEGPAGEAGTATASPGESATSSQPGAASTSDPGSAEEVFFDDFAYSSAGDAALSSHGWSVRTATGAPGLSGATWSANAVSFVTDPSTQNNTVMQLRASTSGSAATTVQAEVSTTSQRFFEGTYAARVYLSDTPSSGADGDQVVQTFFTISPLAYDDDPSYSELDFEYLPNSGWGDSTPTMYLTSWYTYHNSPSWGGDRSSGEQNASLAGWHDLVMQVGSNTVTYFVDGTAVFSSGEKYCPRQAMSIDFNQWFIEGGLLSGSTNRAYDEQIDWVYHVADQIVSPADMSAQVNAYRASSIAFQDTVTS